VVDEELGIAELVEILIEGITGIGVGRIRGCDSIFFKIFQSIL